MHFYTEKNLFHAEKISRTFMQREVPLMQEKSSRTFMVGSWY